MTSLGLTSVAVLLLSGAAAVAADPSDAISGRRIAERFCGSCHAVARGPSPLKDAPPFRDLHKRYRSGGLPRLLSEGMLQPRRLPEEGSPRQHPRMPMAVLEDDQVRDLTAYLRSLQPPHDSKGDRKTHP
jgi:mono/diheme cytochrome c family protein